MRRTESMLRMSAAMVVVAVLAGCATPATHEAMVVAPPPGGGIAIPDQLRGQVALKEVRGGKETNPMWISNIGSPAFEAALEASLRNAGLGAPSRDAGRYLLAADIKNVEQPIMGFSLTVTTTVQYDLTERATNRSAWAQTITRSYTAKAGDAFLGTERLRLANEGSARANIRGLIEELAKGLR